MKTIEVPAIPVLEYRRIQWAVADALAGRVVRLVLMPKHNYWDIMSKIFEEVKNCSAVLKKVVYIGLLRNGADDEIWFNLKVV